MVVIAQLAEHRIVVPSVVGSSPTIHPKSELLVCSSLFCYICMVFCQKASYISAILSVLWQKNRLKSYFLTLAQDLNNK